jgi:hypothetical protein
VAKRKKGPSAPASILPGKKKKSPMILNESKAQKHPRSLRGASFQKKEY